MQSDDIFRYVSGGFASRKGIEVGSFTLHRRGVHHGPQPGALEASVGKEATNEMAIMAETKKALKVTSVAEKFDDATYPFSWLTPAVKEDQRKSASSGTPQCPES